MSNVNSGHFNRNIEEPTATIAYGLTVQAIVFLSSTEVLLWTTGESFSEGMRILPTALTQHLKPVDDFAAKPAAIEVVPTTGDNQETQAEILHNLCLLE
jgi:hypothetical protein